MLKKQIPFLWVIMIILVCSVAVWSVVFNEEQDIIRTSDLPSAAGTKIYPSFFMKTIDPSLSVQSRATDKESYGEINIEYLQFKQASTSSLKALNLLLASSSAYAFAQTVSDFKEAAASDGVSMADFNYDEKVDGGYVNTRTNIFSFYSDVDTYDGGAHNSDFYDSGTFDLATGKTLQLSDLLDNGYSTYLRNYIEMQIKRGAVNCMNCDGLDPDTEGVSWRNDDKDLISQFYVGEKGLFLLFSDYALGPYVESAGGQVIFVPKASLEGYIKRDW